MTDRIVVPPNTIHKVRKPMISILYRLDVYCQQNGLRIGQALINLSNPDDLFYIENDELEKRIKEFIKNSGLQ